MVNYTYTCPNCQKETTVDRPNRIGHGCSMKCGIALREKNRGDFAKRFWAKVKISSTNECWEWQGCMSNGYGTTCRNSKPLKAHRAAYELTYGPIPKGFILLHSCDNPPCCNPSHLRPGTNKENTQDCISKNRRKFGNAKISKETAKKIKELYATRKYNQKTLAVMFNLGQSNISRVILDKVWQS